MNPELNIDRVSLERSLVNVIHDAGAGMMLSSGGFTHDKYAKWDLLAAIGVKASLAIPFNQAGDDAFALMQSFIDEEPGWCFFHLTYDLKNCIEKLDSDNFDRIGFPDLVVFRPQAVMGLRKGSISSFGDKKVIDEVIKASHSQGSVAGDPASSGIIVRQRLSQNDYLEAIQRVKYHIQRGDIYELNFCQEFYGDLDAGFSPVDLWLRLSENSPAPFSAYYRWGSHLLVSASPERFMQRVGNRLISQPIKGTMRRGNGPQEDELLKSKLFLDEKERAENVMIVDLVRNDLSRIALKASVNVPELFGIYTFPGVHQMISTVTAEVSSDIDISDILRASFPMGSMTGAPKIRAMELIEEYESTRRGLYSGSVGYISPEGDFDTNVVIRSILCNMEEQVFSFQAGGAITIASDPASEYSESLLKARALIKAMNPKSVIA